VVSHEENAMAIQAEVERLTGLPIALVIQDTHPPRFAFQARAHDVTMHPPDPADSVAEVAARIARAFWMAALADQESDRCAWP
jgi:hypothetical protein